MDTLLKRLIKVYSLYLCQVSVLLLLSYVCVVFSSVSQSLPHLGVQIGHLFLHTLSKIVVVLHEVRQDGGDSSISSGFAPSLIRVSARICLRFVSGFVSEKSHFSFILKMAEFGPFLSAKSFSLCLLYHLFISLNRSLRCKLFLQKAARES